MNFFKFKYKLLDFIDNWIYPAHCIRNIFYHRFDLVKMKNLSRSKYYDISDRLFHANMQLIVDFIEKENPEKYIQWYGEEGHKYGEHFYDQNPLLPKYKGQYIMDLIKLIYKFYKIDLSTMEKDSKYLTDIWYTYIYKKMHEGEIEKAFNEIEFPDDFETKINKEIVLKYLKDINLIKVEDELSKVIDKLNDDILEQKQEMLHLCIEVREYLWT